MASSSRMGFKVCGLHLRVLKALVRKVVEATPHEVPEKCGVQSDT